MSKLYDRTKAIEAMYELKKEGFTNIALMLIEDGKLLLACDNGWTIKAPDINVDEAESWCNYETDHEGHTHTDSYWHDVGKTYEYWWIFD